VLFLTEDAKLICAHLKGIVGIEPTQSLVTIEGRRVLVQPNPEGRKITGCPNFGPMIKPCTLTRRVQKGYSALIRIDKQPVCLDSVRGLTDGTPQGVVEYYVADPGQEFVTDKR
jgi:hypothetical protein